MIIEKIQVKTFEWSIESLESIVKNLKLNKHQYYLDIENKLFYDLKLGVILKPGDCYQFRIQEEEL